VDNRAPEHSEASEPEGIAPAGANRPVSRAAVPDTSLVITPSLSIPRDELRFRFTRSGGPGGQHVNRTSTQVELTFDVRRSSAVSAAQRMRLTQALGRRIDSDGVVHVVSHATRSQLENRADVTARFTALLASALKPVKARKATRPTRAARERRLAAKKARGTTKLRRKLTGRELE
jgi:ribosome-associated protein